MTKFLFPAWALILSACQMAAPGPACRPTDAERQAWAEASKMRTRDAYRNFLAQYPDGCYAPRVAAALQKPVLPVPVAAIPGGGRGGGSAPAPY